MIADNFDTMFDADGVHFMYNSNTLAVNVRINYIIKQIIVHLRVILQ